MLLVYSPTTLTFEQMSTYSSKLDRSMVAFPALITTPVLAYMVYIQLWIAAIIVLLVLLYIADIFLHTTYCIEGNELKIKAGRFYKLNVDILLINSIKQTRDISKGPANSFDRLDIQYKINKQRHSVLVSPLMKEAFIQELHSINPEIQIK